MSTNYESSAAYLNLIKIVFYFSIVQMRHSKEIWMLMPFLVTLWSKFVIFKFWLNIYISSVQITDFWKILKAIFCVSNALIFSIMPLEHEFLKYKPKQWKKEYKCLDIKWNV